METAQLKNFATKARTTLLAEVNARLSVVLAPYSDERNEVPRIVAQLEKAIAAEGGGEKGRAAVADKVAYTWFNRIIALRFMDAKGYTGIGVVSPQPGSEGGQPEILAEAKLGRIDREVVSERTEKAVMKLLNQERRSKDPQGEAYGLLLAEYCHYWHRAMPFMFEREGDYTELLIPGRLLAGNSVMSRAVAVLTKEVCKDVEVIGWLYQFYISERKEEVFKGFKKNKKAGAAEIPAATQLFTPDWIVRYLVQNSLGRLWLLNRPTSRLAEQMEYYIEPVDEEIDFLKIDSPEELKLIDPACGSGHMLTYAFDLLYAIYEEEGYAPSEIPALILANNLYGTEIDPRAGSLAAFALTMKARARQRTFFNKKVEPNICVLERIAFTPAELDLLVTPDGERDAEESFWNQFQYADSIGSLVRPEALLVEPLRLFLDVRQTHADDLFDNDLYGRARRVIMQADYLVSRYHVVVANPPYMGIRNMDASLSDFAKNSFPISKADLFAMFIERAIMLTLHGAYIGMITMQSWMFLQSFSALRNEMLNHQTLVTMAHLGAGAFDTVPGEVVSTTAFVLINESRPNLNGVYARLTELRGELSMSVHFREMISSRSELHLASTRELLQVPGAPIAYWLTESMNAAFSRGRPLSEIAASRQGMATSDNARFTRFWFEVSDMRFGRGLSREVAASSNFRWFPYNKGGDFRKWYGNQEVVVDWEFDGREILRFAASKYGSATRTIKNIQYYFRPSVSWSKVGTGMPSFRYYPEGFIFDVAGTSIFGSEQELLAVMAICNSSVAREMMAATSPTMNLEVGTLAEMPIIKLSEDALNTARELVRIHRDDWNSHETSWDFTVLPTIGMKGRLEDRAEEEFAEARNLARYAQSLETKLNTEIAQGYGVEREIDPEVPLSRITMRFSPSLQSGSDRTESKTEGVHSQIQVKNLVSYSVGCVFGRYSLDEPGLVLANQGDNLQEYLSRVPNPSFFPDADNVIPIVDGDWFEDDIVGRVREFLRVTFGEEHFEENLRFVTEALGVKDLRSYFLKFFYQDHWKRYKKRPIYWMFSSPNGSFNALIYMHRYTPSTVSTVLEYLRQYQAKLEASRQHHENLSFIASTTREKAKAQKEAERLRKILVELDKYEHEVLYPLATEQVHIDLDDGVKANYPKFGSALKKIPGLEAKA